MQGTQLNPIFVNPIGQALTHLLPHSKGKDEFVKQLRQVFAPLQVLHGDTQLQH